LTSTDTVICQAACELGRKTGGRRLFVIASVGDLEVLQNCARPLRTLWPRVRIAGVYMPAEYMSRIKRPGLHLGAHRGRDSTLP
jgi:hypothetical protein